MIFKDSLGRILPNFNKRILLASLMAAYILKYNFQYTNILESQIQWM